jgi:hypothetical protein
MDIVRGSRAESRLGKGVLQEYFVSAVPEPINRYFRLLLTEHLSPRWCSAGVAKEAFDRPLGY